MISFYGGQKGNDLTIVKSYATLAALQADIANLNYNDYVLVTADNQLYRIGYDGEIPLGQVLKNDTQSATTRPPAQLDSYTTIATHSTDASYHYGSYYGTELIDGATATGMPYNSYVDSLGTTHLGFKFPIPKIDITGDYITPLPSTDPAYDSTHPFHYQYVLNLPQLHDGTSFRNLRIIEVTAETRASQIYNINNENIASTLILGNRALVYNADYISGSTILDRIYFLGYYNNIESIDITDGVLTITDTLGNTETTSVLGIKTIDFTNGEWTITYTDDDTDTFSMVAPTSISYDDSTNLVSVTYNNGDSDDLYSPNFIKDLEIDDDHHLKIKYSDSAYGDPDEQGYIDYGAMYVERGLMIGQNITKDTIVAAQGTATTSAIITYLNENYPDGIGIEKGDVTTAYLVDENGDYITDDQGNLLVIYTYNGLVLTEYALGKCVTVGNALDPKMFFAYDYSIDRTTSLAKGWYYVGKMPEEDNRVEHIIDYMEELNRDDQALIDSLKPGGIWFGLEDDVETSET